MNRISAMKVGTDGVLIGGWAFRSLPPEYVGNAADVGCGSGVIALMLAQRFKNLTIEGIEIEIEAAKEAYYNFANSPWERRLTVCNADYGVFAEKRDECTLNLIISNPPYFQNGALAPDMTRRIARHEGNLNFKMLIETSEKLLSDHGRLAMIIPSEHIETVRNEDLSGRLHLDRICWVSTVPRKPPKRIMIEFVKSDTDQVCQEEHLTIHSASGDFTDEYRKLLADFYLRF